MNSTKQRLYNSNSFILDVIKEAILLVDEENFLFINKALEEMVEFIRETVIDDNTPSILLIEERKKFFIFINRLMEGAISSNEVIVDFMNRNTGPFLCKVTCYPFVDMLDNKPKCACILSDPLFYKKLFEGTSVLMGILEYIEEEKDCAIFRANQKAKDLFIRRFSNSSNSNSLNNCIIMDTSPIDSEICTIDDSFVNSDISFQEELNSVLFLDGKRLCHDLGFQFVEQDHNFFSESKSNNIIPAVPYIKCFKLETFAENEDRKRLKQVLWLESTVLFLGHSLNNRPMFTIVSENVTQTMNQEIELQKKQTLLENQGVFFANMIHELRTPLSGLLGISGLLKETLLTNEQGDLLDTIEACGDSLLSLMGNILDLSSLERNKLSLSSKSFGVVNCIEEALDMVSQQAYLKTIDLLYKVEPSSLNIIGDNIRTRQILLILLSNAIKFTPEKSLNSDIVIQVNVEQQTGEKKHIIHFKIIDKGIGISAKDQNNLFKSFSQANINISQSYGGTGLGLAVAKSLVELMGGKIWVESNENKGSIFHFIISSNIGNNLENRKLNDIERFAQKTAFVQLKEKNVTENLYGRLSNIGFTPSVDNKTADVILIDQDIVDIFPSHIPRIYIGWHNNNHKFNQKGQFLRKPIRSKNLMTALCLLFYVNPIQIPVIKSNSNISTRYCRILIVDDNILNRKIAKHMLEQLGYHSPYIIDASNGLEAMNLMAQQIVDVVLMDLEMPIMNGEDTTRNIREKWGKTAKPYIIGLTASDTEQAKERCINSGMNAFLSKPLRIDTLSVIFDSIKGVLVSSK